MISASLISPFGWAQWMIILGTYRILGEYMPANAYQILVVFSILLAILIEGTYEGLPSIEDEDND